MAPGMMRQMIANIQNATFFTITADEAADVSNKKQLVIWIRWVDDCFVIYEDFIEMHPLNKCRSSSSNTKECPTENKFKHLERPGAVLSWRGDEDRRENWRNYANSNYQRKMLIHALLWTSSDLAVADAIISVQCISDSLDTVHETGKLVKNTKLNKIWADAIMSHVVYMHFALQYGLCVGKP